MKLTIQNQIILSIAGVVIAFLAVVFLVIWPQIQKIGELGDKIEAADSEIQSARQLLSRRMEARDNAASTSAEYILLTNRLPDAPELPALIIEMQDASDLAGVSLQRIAPEAASVDLGTHTAYQIKMTMRGRWADYIDFLRRLDKMTRGVRVVTTSVKRKDDQVSEATTATVEEETEVNALMMIEVYTVNQSLGTTATTPPATE